MSEPEANDICPICDHEFYNSELARLRNERVELLKVICDAHWAFVVELGATGPASSALAQTVAKIKMK